MRRRQNGKERLRAGGFTLIEMALIVLLSGIIFVAVFPLYQNYIIRDRHKTTLENLNLAHGALREFYGNFGHYPCPADPDLAPGEANYGIERCRPSPADPCPPFTSIVCTNVGSRDADGDSTPDFVMIGALPSKTLYDNNRFSKFTPANGIDGYGNQILYAVSETMTPGTYTISNRANPQLGAVSLKDENNRDVLQPADSAHYVIVSHGENGRGAFTKDGVYVGDCSLIDLGGTPAPAGNNLGLGGIRVELENCDRNDAVFVSGLKSYVDNDSYFDDFLFFNAMADSMLWRRSDNSPPNAVYLYNTNLGNVGVGLDAPARKFHVDGDIRVETRVRTEETEGYCDLDGDDCLNPVALGGVGMTPCPAGEAATGIEDNQLETLCEPVFDASPPVSSCPAGTALRGFSNLGNLICEPI